MPGPRIPPGVVNLRHLHPQVTARALGGITWTVAASAPSSPNQGDLWTNSASQYQLSQWTGSQWFAVPVNAGSLTGENFQISATGQFHYASPPAFANWSFESGLQGWTASNAEAFPSPAWSAVGGYSALLTYTSGASWSFASPLQTVQAGNQVYVSATVNAPQALGAVGMQLAWYNSGGGLISSSSGPTAALAANTPTQLAYNAAPPSGAVSCQIIVQDAETSVTGNQLYVDNVYIAGQLATAIAPSAGTDLLGNPHPAGVAALGAAGAMAVLTDFHNDSVPAVRFVSGVSEENSTGRLQVQVNAAGTSTEGLGMYLMAPTVTGQSSFPNIVLFSASKDLSIAPQGFLGWQSGSGESGILTWTSAGINVSGTAAVSGTLNANGLLNVNAGAGTAASSLVGGVIISQVDNSFVNQPNPTSPSRICKVWGIPAGDPLELTVYRLSVPVLSGTWQGIPLSFQIAAFGQAIASLTIGGALMSAGTGYCGDLTATLIITQTGSSGILTGSVKVNLGVASANQLPTGGANGAGGFVGVQVVEPVSGIGATDDSMTVQASFGSGNAGQSIEGFGSIFERIGGNA